MLAHSRRCVFSSSQSRALPFQVQAHLREGVFVWEEKLSRESRSPVTKNISGPVLLVREALSSLIRTLTDACAHTPTKTLYRCLWFYDLVLCRGKSREKFDSFDSLCCFLATPAVNYIITRVLYWLWCSREITWLRHMTSKDSFFLVQNGFPNTIQWTMLVSCVKRF